MEYNSRAANSSAWDGYKNVSVPTGAESTIVKKEDATVEQMSMTTTQLVQKAVKVARRADQRLKKSITELDNCKKKWLQYQKEIRELYLQQQEAYQKDVDNLEVEVAKNQDHARWPTRSASRF